MINDESTAKIVLSNEVWNQIKYLTENYDNEIGAVGLVSIQSTDIKDEQDSSKVIDTERHFFVEKLIFPKQEVTAATIHIKPEMWNDVIKEAGIERMGDISFYWHRHPAGSATHSGTDKEDTFDTFLNSNTGKPFFLFLQTSQGNNGEILTESRIELRNPIRATITNSMIKLRYRLPDSDAENLPKGFVTPIKKMWKKYEGKMDKLNVSDDDKEKAKKEFESIFTNFHNTFTTRLTCNKIIKEKIVEPSYSYTYHGANNYNWRQSNSSKFWKGTKKNSSDIESLRELFNVNKNGTTFDNSTINGIATRPEEFAKISFLNGCVYVEAGQLFSNVMNNACSRNNKKPGVLKDFINYKHLKMNKNNDTGRTEWKILPAKKSYHSLIDGLKNLFEEFNDAIILEHSNVDSEYFKNEIEQNPFFGYDGWDEKESYSSEYNYGKNGLPPAIWTEIFTDSDPRTDPHILKILDKIEALYDLSWIDNIGVVSVGTDFIGQISFRKANVGTQYITKFEGAELVEYITDEDERLEDKLRARKRSMEVKKKWKH